MRILYLLYKNWIYILLLSILCVGFVLRSHDLYTWPRLGATFDEYAWPWLGINLIQHHVPISWSPHEQYKNAKNITYQKTHFRLVTPYLEHPPLFGLIAGSYAMFSGVKDMYHIDLQHIRGLALLLGVISIVMVFFFTLEIYDKKTALLASFLYAIIPSVVAGSRLVQNENFFIPCFLLALYCAHRYVVTKNPWLRAATVLICGLLILAKIPWASTSLAVILLFTYHKRYKDAVIILFASLLSLLGFLFYGFSLDAKLFLSLWQLQLNRYSIAFDSIFALFTTPVLTDRNYLDGWIYSGWFAFAIVATNIKKHIWILLPLLSYFAVFIFAIPNEPGHGWYRYPFFPFLVISLAICIKEYFNKNYFITFFFLLLTGLSMLQNTWVPVFGFSFMLFRLFLLAAGGIFLPLFFSKTKWLGTIISYALLLFVVSVTVVASLSYNEQ